MAKHISTKQVIEHVKTAVAAKIDGVSLPLSITDTAIVIGELTFPLDKFDIGGMSPESIQLIDTNDMYYDITLLDADGVSIIHPNWETEEYDPSRVRNTHITNQSNLVPMSIYVPKNLGWHIT